MSAGVGGVVVVHGEPFLAEHLSRAAEAGLDGGNGEVEEFGDLAAAEALNASKDEGLAELLGKGEGVTEQAVCLFGMCGVGSLGIVRELAVFETEAAADAPEAAGRLAGGVDGDAAEPGLEGLAVAEGVELGDELDGDVLHEVFDLDLAGLVGQQDGGEPAAMAAPETSLGGRVTEDRFIDVGAGGGGVFEIDADHCRRGCARSGVRAGIGSGGGSFSRAGGVE